jgi:UDP-N-acetylmuramate dehydrogenase
MSCPSVRPVDPVPPLSSLTSLRVGGPPVALVEADSVSAAMAVLEWANAKGLDVLVLGGGSNLVVADGGVGAAVLRMKISGRTAESDGSDVLMTVGAGASWDAVVEGWVADGLVGGECLAGIPGTVGAVPIQNVGAYGAEVSEMIEWVEVIRTRDRELVRVPGPECGFGYRTSRFRREPGEAVVVRVCFRLRRGGGTEIRYRELANALGAGLGDRCDDLAAVRDAVLGLRTGKGMVLDTPELDGLGTAGSFFVNPVMDDAGLQTMIRRLLDRGVVGGGDEVPRFAVGDGFKVPAAWLIERSGFAKGYRHGAVGLSPHHALALVTRSGARCADVLDLADRIRGGVARTAGLVLQLEPVLWGVTEDETTKGDIA